MSIPVTGNEGNACFEALERLIGLESYRQPLDQETSDIFFVEIFESDDKLLEKIGICERNDNPFQVPFSVCPAVDARLVIGGKSMAERTDFWVRN